jgi:hypothetical protein
MKRTVKQRLGWLLWAAVLLAALVLVVLAHPARHSLKELLGAELVGVTNSVAFITITNRSGIPLTVHVVAQSSSPTGGWHPVVSAQYPPLSGAGTRLVKIGLSEGTNAQRVMILCSPAPGRVREAAFDFCLKLKMKRLIPLFWPRAQEVAILSIEPKR